MNQINENCYKQYEEFITSKQENNVLTPYAWKEYIFRNLPSTKQKNNGTPYKVNLQSANGIGLVYAGNPAVAESYEVHIPNKTCSCYVWQQTGIPCIHVFILIDKINSGKDNDNKLRISFDELFFHKTSLHSYWELMFDTCQFTGFYPDDATIRNKSFKNPFPIQPVIEKINHLQTTSKRRIASSGDNKKGGYKSLSLKSYIACQYCGKLITFGAMDKHQRSAGGCEAFNQTSKKLKTGEDINFDIADDDDELKPGEDINFDIADDDELKPGEDINFNTAGDEEEEINLNNIIE